jgi:hypothetical protein
MKKNFYMMLISLLLCVLCVSCNPSQTNVSTESQDTDDMVTTTEPADVTTEEALINEETSETNEAITTNADETVTTESVKDSETVPEKETPETELPTVEYPQKLNTHSYEEYLTYIQSCDIPSHATFEQISTLGMFAQAIDISPYEGRGGVRFMYVLKDADGREFVVYIESMALSDSITTQEILFEINTNDLRKLDATFASGAVYTRDGISYVYAKNGALLHIEWEYDGWQYTVCEGLSDYPTNASTVLAQLLDARTATAAMASLMAPKETTESPDAVTTTPEDEVPVTEQPIVDVPPKFDTDSYDEYLTYIQACGVPEYATFEQIRSLGTFTYMVDSYDEDIPAGMSVGYSVTDSSGHRFQVIIQHMDLENTITAREIIFKIDTDNMRDLGTTFSGTAEYTKDGISYIYGKNGRLMSIEWVYNGWKYSITRKLSEYPTNANTVLAQLLDARTATEAMASLMAPKA